MLDLIDKKYFKYSFFLLILAEVLSYVGWTNYIVNAAFFVVIILATLILSLKKLEYGLYILLAELFIGSKGYLFSLHLDDTVLSIRMGIFLVVMAVWLYTFFMHHAEVEHSEGQRNPSVQILMMIKKSWTIKSLALLGVMLFWAFVNGIIHNNNFGDVFLDFNNWLYFLMILPCVAVFSNQNTNKHESVKNVISILSAAVVVISLKTFLLFYIFVHQSAWALPEIYKWIRDSGVGEITAMGGGFYRIFMQSQIYVLLAFFIFLFLNSKINKKNKIGYYAFLAILLATICLSFSRSFWVGLVAGLLAFFVLSLLIIRDSVGIILRKKCQLILVVIVSLGIILMIIKLPPKIENLNFGVLFGARVTQGEAASSSRMNQLKPLVTAMSRHLFWGSGFGTTVTYYSVDPRIVPITAGNSGEVTTYAFEWGYLDMILKFGLIGLGIYLFFICEILKRLVNFQFQNTKNYPLQFGFAAALIALLCVNIFSPYLNHPLGIGFIIIAGAIAFQKYE